MGDEPLRVHGGDPPDDSWESRVEKRLQKHHDRLDALEHFRTQSRTIVVTLMFCSGLGI